MTVAGPAKPPGRTTAGPCVPAIFVHVCDFRPPFANEVPICESRRQLRSTIKLTQRILRECGDRGDSLALARVALGAPAVKSLTVVQRCVPSRGGFRR